MRRRVDLDAPVAGRKVITNSLRRIPAGSLGPDPEEDGCLQESCSRVL